MNPNCLRVVFIVLLHVQGQRGPVNAVVKSKMPDRCLERRALLLQAAPRLLQLQVSERSNLLSMSDCAGTLRTNPPGQTLACTLPQPHSACQITVMTAVCCYYRRRSSCSSSR